jgi:hypothetical protein
MTKDILASEPDLRPQYLAARIALDGAIYPTVQAAMRHTRDLPELGHIALLLIQARHSLAAALGEREDGDA